jgi:hypothetical protein
VRPPEGGRITFRISAMGDPMAQLRRLVEEVLPYV